MYNLKLLKALADETRLNIVLALMKKELSVLEIVDIVKKSQPNVSIALRILQESGFLTSRKDGKKTYYDIKEKEAAKKLLELVSDG